MIKDILENLWISPEAAKKYGCTHYCFLGGIVPGFIGDIESEAPIFVGRSCLLYPVEEILNFFMANASLAVNGEELFALKVGREI